MVRDDDEATESDELAQIGSSVQARFAGRWVDGFEVYNVMRERDGVRYQLRRTSDGSTVSQLFAADEVRLQSTPAPAAGTRSGNWSRPSARS
jgi:hypothetical protein